MANITGVANQQIDQQIQTRVDGTLGQIARVASQAPQFRNGAMVMGHVLNTASDGTYMVQVQDSTGMSQQLSARATLPLIVGQQFRAIWDNSGETPILRLSESDFALLSKFGEGGEREIATALLARGMPVTSEMIAAIQSAWRKSGETTPNLNSILDLWARGLPMTAANLQIVSWYSALQSNELTQIWNKLRSAFKARVKNGEDPMSALKSLMDDDDDIADFLKGHSFLSKPLKKGLETASMGTAYWPVGDEEEPLMARIWVSTDESHPEQQWWQVGFDLDGEALGTVSGDIESDSNSYVVSLKTDNDSVYQLLRSKRDALRHELEDVPMPLQHIGINRGRRVERSSTSNRSLDIKV